MLFAYDEHTCVAKITSFLIYIFSKNKHFFQWTVSSSWSVLIMLEWFLPVYDYFYYSTTTYYFILSLLQCPLYTIVEVQKIFCKQISLVWSKTKNFLKVIRIALQGFNTLRLLIHIWYTYNVSISWNSDIATIFLFHLSFICRLILR